MIRSLFFSIFMFAPIFLQNVPDYLPKTSYQHNIEYTNDGKITINGNIIEIKLKEIDDYFNWNVTNQNNKIIFTHKINKKQGIQVIFDLSNYYFPTITIEDSLKESSNITAQITITTPTKGSFFFNDKKIKIKKNQENILRNVEWIGAKQLNNIISVKTSNEKLTVYNNTIKFELKNNEKATFHVSNLNTKIIQDQKEFNSLENHLDFGLFQSLNPKILTLLNIINKYIGNIFISLCIVIFIIILFIWQYIYQSILISQRMRRAQPEIDAASQEFKNNSEKQIKATNEIYKRYDINIGTQIFGQLTLFLPFYMIKNLSLSLNYLNLINSQYNFIILIFLAIAVSSYYSIFLERKNIIISSLMTVAISFYYYSYLNILMLAIMHFELTCLYMYTELTTKKKILK